MAEKKQKKILSKVEWFLLIFALGILLMVLLQNNGINMIETHESIEISEEERRAQEADRMAEPEANSFYEKKSQARND